MKRRKIWIAVVAVMLLVSLSTPSVKAAANKTKIKQVIKTYMKEAKNTNAKKMSKCIKSPGEFKFTPKEVKKAFPYFSKIYLKNKKISYTYKSINVTGKTAVVKVSVKSPNIKKAADKAMEDFIKYAFNHPNMSENESDTLFFKLLKKAIQKRGVQMYKHTMTFKMVKTAHGWKINKSTDADYDLVFGRFFSIMKEYEKAFK